MLRHLFGLAAPRGTRRGSLELEVLSERFLPSATPLRLAVMGDSLSAPYAGEPYGAAGDRSWVEQLPALRPMKVVIADEAFPGATSDSLLHSESGHAAQAPAVAALVARHAVDDVVLMIGANDVAQDLPLLSVDPARFVATFVTDVVANVETAVSEVAAAGHVGMVVGTVPDVAVTPAFQASVPAAAVPVVETALTLANQQLETFAAAHGIPVVDLYGLTHLAQHPPTLGGVQIANLYAPDYFHPNTVGQGILADTVLEALREGDGVNTKPLRLSDQDILTEANVAHQPGRTYFDVTPFVIANEDQHEGGCDGATVFQFLGCLPEARRR
jgi:lysophospholipase L1-like esterase